MFVCVAQKGRNKDLSCHCRTISDHANEAPYVHSVAGVEYEDEDQPYSCTAFEKGFCKFMNLYVYTSPPVQMVTALFSLMSLNQFLVNING